MTHRFIPLFIITFLWVGSFFTSLVSAQALPNDRTGINQDTTQPLTQTTTQTQDTQANNWWWLISLIALPILFILLRSARDRDSDKEMYRDEEVVGSRGGKAKHDEIDDDWI